MKLITLTLATAFMYAKVQAGSVGIDLFHDGNCQDQFQSITVQGYTCYVTNPGFSSMRVNARSSTGSVTAFTRSNCGEPTAGSHGYNSDVGPCLKDFGFVGNAINYLD